MADLIRTLSDNFGVFVILVIAGTMVCSGLFKAIVTILVNSSRERTRREIAAYIAEGTISPEQGERLLKAQINGKKHAA